MLPRSHLSRLGLVLVAAMLAFSSLTCSAAPAPSSSYEEPPDQTSQLPPKIFAGCDLNQSANIAATSSNCLGGGASLDLGCLAPPSTFVQGENQSQNGIPEFDVFAWNTFVAMSWPAIHPDTHNFQRGIPDKSKSFLQAGSEDLLVWETYTEKRELFYPISPAEDPGPFNKCVEYGSPPPGPDHRTGCQTVPRRVMQARKAPFTSLDETDEVASEALEAPNDLCLGHTTTPCAGKPSASSPACCRVHGQPVGPRVWHGRPSAADQPFGPPVSFGGGVEPVVYEVKVNYDFYHYVRQAGLYDDDAKNTAAAAGTINLPMRTSAPRLTGESVQPSQSPLAYSAYECAQHYPDKVSPTGTLLPCLAGSMQFKAAWLPLETVNGKPSAEDLKKYHVTEGVYYTDPNADPAKGYFGLIGLHIIQRIHTATDPDGGQLEATGGSFVFATWEHVENDTGFTYSNYLEAAVPTGDAIPAGFYPTVNNAFDADRQQNILPGTCQVNQQVHAEIRAANPDSVWLNYALVGTQYMAVDEADNPPDQAHRLANLVIETNDGLQNFSGLPPYVQPIASFHRIPANNVPAYDRAANNNAFQYKTLGPSYTGTNMGGCMGCHGVAQLKGSAFSFVLLLGQAGAEPDTEDSFDVPAQPTEPSVSPNKGGD